MLGALFGFRGRLSRAGFWEAVAGVVLIDVLIVLGAMYVADSGRPAGQGLLQAAPWALAILTLWSLPAASVKRLHDRGRTGWLILLALIPVIGWLWLLIDLFVLEGEEGRNRYGQPPHAPEGADALRSRFDWDAQPAAPAPFAAAPTASAFDWASAPAEHDHAPAAPEVHEDHAPEPPAEAPDLRPAHVDQVEAHEAPAEPEADPEPEVHAVPPADPVLDITHDPAPAAVHEALSEDDKPLQILTH